MMIRAVLLAVLVLVGALPARSEPAAIPASLFAAWQNYRAGDFVAAETMGVAIGTPNALALAARAANVRAVYLVSKTERAEILERARRHGEAALALDPSHIEAGLQLVVALGQGARLMSTVDALAARVADRTKSVLDHMSRNAKGNAYYHAVMGAWHAELVLRAGPTAARLIYGARWSLALQHYEHALTLAPGSHAIATEYAKILLAHGSETAKAHGLLRGVASSRPTDAVESLIVEEAKALLAGAPLAQAPR